MTKKKLKLFIWTDFCSDWTEGLAFAIASDETEARKLIIKKFGGTGDGIRWGDLEIRRLDHRVSRYVQGGG